MVSTNVKIAVALIIGLIVGAAPAYYYGTTTVAPSGGVTTITQTTTRTNTQTNTQTVTVTASPGEPVTLVISTWGGDDEAFLKGAFALFEQENNVIILHETNTGADAVAKIQAERNDPQHDMVMAELRSIIPIENEGLVVTDFSEDDLPNMRKLHPLALRGTNTPYLWFYFLAIAYNTDVVKSDPPTSYADLWDPRFEGLIHLVHPSITFTHELIVRAAYMNGGDQYNIDPGFEKIKELKPNVLGVIKSVFPTYQSVATGESGIAMMNWGAISLYAEGGASVAGVPLLTGPAEAPYMNPVMFTIVANRPAENIEMAKKLLNFLMSEEIQAQYSEIVGYTPSNIYAPASEQLRDRAGIPEELTIAEFLDSSEILDQEYIALNMPEWVETFDRIWAE
jgi:putative spermidine/putrescine transport system substrate-binding protein